MCFSQNLFLAVITQRLKNLSEVEAMTFYSGVCGCVCVAVFVTCCREHVCVHVFVFIYYIPEMQILHKIREGRGKWRGRSDDAQVFGAWQTVAT
jgi:hypothetical protein